MTIQNPLPLLSLYSHLFRCSASHLSPLSSLLSQLVAPVVSFVVSPSFSLVALSCSLSHHPRCSLTSLPPLSSPGASLIMSLSLHSLPLSLHLSHHAAASSLVVPRSLSLHFLSWLCISRCARSLLTRHATSLVVLPPPLSSHLLSVNSGSVQLMCPEQMLWCSVQCRCNVYGACCGPELPCQWGQRNDDCSHVVHRCARRLISSGVLVIVKEQRRRSWCSTWGSSWHHR